MTTQQIAQILQQHKQWLKNKGGQRANLYEANLSGDNLYEANLTGAYLSGAKGILQFGPMPTRGRMIYFVKHESDIMVQAGCFWGNLDQLETAVKQNHNCPMYLGIIALVREQWKQTTNS